MPKRPKRCEHKKLMKEDKSNSLLLKSILLSTAFHAVALTVFFTSPIHFQPVSPTPLGKAPASLEENNLVILKKEAALEDAMRHFVVISSAAPTPLDAVQPFSLEPQPV